MYIDSAEEGLTLHTGYLAYFLLSADFFSKSTFCKIISGIPSECQAVGIQIRPDFLSGLVWVQTVCKSH